MRRPANSTAVLSSPPANLAAPANAEKPLSSVQPTRFVRLAIAAAIFVLLFLLNRQLLTNQVFAEGDIMYQNFPVRAYYQQALRSGQGVLWMPGMFCGYYLFAEGQGGFAHPLHYLLYRFLPLTVAFNLEALLPYIASLVGAYYLLRRFDFPREACLFGCLGWAFCGSNLMHWGHINAIQVTAHLPFLLLTADIALTTRSRRTFAATLTTLSLLTASQILLGHVFYFWCNVATLTAWVAWRLVCPGALPMANVPRARRAARFACFVITLLLGILLASVQILPGQDLVAHSGRQTTSFLYRMQMSAHPINLVSWWSPLGLRDQHISPKFWGAKLELNPYNGMTATVLLGWFLARWRYAGRWRWLMLAAVVFGGLCLLVSFGYFGYLYRYVSFLPLLNRFRGPSRYILLVQFAWMLLQVFCITDLLKVLTGQEAVPRLRSIRPLFVPLGFSLLTALFVTALDRFLPTSFTRSLFGSVPNVWESALLAAVTTGLVFLVSRRYIVAFYALLALLVCDLFIHWSGIYPASAFKPLARHLQAVQVMLPAPGSDRIATGQYRLDPLLLPGYRLADGYAALFPQKTLPIEKGDGVTMQVPLDSLPPLRLTAATWSHHHDARRKADVSQWYPVPSPLPRARLVTQAIVSHDVAKDVFRYPLETVALTRQPVPLPPASAPGTARVVEETNGVITIETDAPTRQLLVLSESYHPGWKVEQEENPSAPLIPVYDDYIGIVVEAGLHRTTLRFEPDSYKNGKKLSLLGVLLLGLYFVILRYLPMPRRIKEQQ